MIFVPIGIGLILGFLLFSFIYILTKRSEKRYIASVVTAFSGIVIIVASILLLGGFEGMGFGIIGIGFVVIAIAGLFVFLFKPVDQHHTHQLSVKDKRNLMGIPAVFVLVVLFTFFIS
ncbi:YesK family protein [Sporosarcina sp. D27]|uniref:YesK family protein n=1 Tax=Sporosarcina sp. D27 TaxID=1382305 RepID=UPI00047209F1|nr:YesK family protein [Sporosarcina sp. D27]